MSENLANKYRPKSLDDLVGQDEAVKTLRVMAEDGRLARNHAYLMHGPSGSGKTTTARIVARMLGAGDHEIYEYNAASIRGIDSIREVDKARWYKPMHGDARVWVFDECSNWSREASESSLKMLEDESGSSYFILCTTEPKKLPDTLRSRCQEVRFRAVGEKDLIDLCVSVAKKEKARTGTSKVYAKIAEYAEGNVRKALSMLEKVLGVRDEAEALNLIEKADVERAAFDLVKLMMPFDGRKGTWKEVAEVLKSVEGENAEGIRNLILACARRHLLSGKAGAGNAYLVINAFRESLFYAPGIAGHALLAANCYEVLGQKTS